MAGDPVRPSIDAAFVSRLAGLARLALTDDERTRIARDLGRILEHVDALAEIDVEGVPPLTWAFDGGAALRDDAPRPSLSAADALREAPRSDGEAFVVPGFVDEG